MQVCLQTHLQFIPSGDEHIMSVNNNYDDDYYESSDFDMINFDEEYDEESGSRPNPSSSQSTSPHKKKSISKKKKRLEDWLEEKRLRDELRDENID